MEWHLDADVQSAVLEFHHEHALKGNGTISTLLTSEDGLDIGNRRACLRVITTLFAVEGNLLRIEPTFFCQVVRDVFASNPSEWYQTRIGQNVLLVLTQLREAVRKEKIGTFKSTANRTTQTNIIGRLRNLVTIKAKLLRMIDIFGDQLKRTSGFVWFGDANLQTAMRTFHDDRAREPTEEMKEAKKFHEMITKELRDKMRLERICNRIEYSGSAYEGLKTNVDIEFDVLVVLDKVECEEKDGPEKNGAGLYTLEGKSVGNPLFPGNLHLLSAMQMREDFDDVLKRALESIPQLAMYVTVESHGPSVQLNVSSNIVKDPLLRRKAGYTSCTPIVRDPWYSVDMAPAVQSKTTGNLYVAGPYEDETAWKLSYPLEEKDLFKNIDARNGCRRECARVVKVMRDIDPGLKKLRSYVIKTALMYEIDAHPNSDDWERSLIGVRVMDLLVRLRKGVESGNLEEHDVPKRNTLDSQENIPQILRRLKNLTTRKASMMKLLERS